MDQPTATLLAALLIVLGGGAGYVFQKLVDRRESRHNEFRAALHSFIVQAKKAESGILAKDGQVPFDEIAEYEASFMSLRILATPEVVAALDNSRRALSAAHASMEAMNQNEVDTAFEEYENTLGELEIASRNAIGTPGAVPIYERTGPKLVWEEK